jgi:hypothetical protein
VQGVARPGWSRQRVVKQMEHHTGADETAVDGTAAGGTAADRTGADRIDADRTGADQTGADHTGADHTGAAGAANQSPVPATGQPRVDAALRLLGRLPGLPVSEHSELFEQVHAQLSEVLGELDSGAAGPAGVTGG